ncbi:MAG TPA: hypothetical protein VGD43_19715 [Micromonospora sp.]
MSDEAWEEYLSAVRQLDAVRRSAAVIEGEHAQAVRTAREELGSLRTRLAPQYTRLRDLGVPEVALRPSPAEVSVAGRSMTDGPRSVTAALHRARAAADNADLVLAGAVGPAHLAPNAGDAVWRHRPLLVYGSLALLLLILVACVAIVGTLVALS